MEIKYTILKGCAESLIRRIDELEQKRIDNIQALEFHINDEMLNMIAFFNANINELVP